MTTTADVPATATLQMIRAEISVRDFQRWMGTKRLQDPDHAMHCLMAECFGDLAPKPFRLILPRGAPTGVLYGYGQADADALREEAAIGADPLQYRMVTRGLESKLMPSQWQAGRSLNFEVRIRPTRRLKRPADNGEHTAERDAFLMQALDPNRETKSREEVYGTWLAEQLQKSGAAELNSSSLRSFLRTRSQRKQGGRRIEGPDAVMQGSLTIKDPEEFSSLLARGIGRNRAYGYGMLLLRPGRG